MRIRPKNSWIYNLPSKQINGVTVYKTVVPKTGEIRWIDPNQTKDFNGIVGYRFYNDNGILNNQYTQALQEENKQLKDNQPVYGETNRAANERADKYANKVSPSALDIVSAGTLGGLNNLLPTQWARRAYDLGEVIKGNMPWSEYGNRFIQGNEGVVSADYAKAHPYKSMAINTIGDIATLGAASIARKMPGWYRAMQAENKATQDIVANNWRNVGKGAQIVDMRNPENWMSHHWDIAQKKAWDTKNLAERQRLRDLHFKFNTPDNKYKGHLYHNTDTQFNEFNPEFIGKTDSGYYGRGFYFTPHKIDANSTLGPIQKDVYVYLKNPRKITSSDYISGPLINNDGAIVRNGEEGWITLDGTPPPDPNEVMEVVSNIPSRIKLADADAFDDAGNLIPLSQRDNFMVNDIRGEVHNTYNHPEQFIHPAEAIRTGRQYVRPTVGRRSITTREPLMSSNSKITITPKNAASITPVPSNSSIRYAGNAKEDYSNSGYGLLDYLRRDKINAFLEGKPFYEMDLGPLGKRKESFPSDWTVTKTPFSNESKEIINNSAKPRILAQAEKDIRDMYDSAIDGPDIEKYVKKELSYIEKQLDAKINEGYELGSDALFKAYDEGNTATRTGGLQLTNNGKIVLREGESPESFAVHEWEHRRTNSNIGGSHYGNEKRLLKKAFTKEFRELSETVPDFKGMNMEDEMVTTVSDAREALIGKTHLRKTAPDLQNKMINKSSDEKVFAAVEKANAYGSFYIKKMRELGKLTPELAQNIREALKYVGGYAIPTAIAAGTLYGKQE